MKNKNGFTLVELLAVIVILGLITSIAVFAVTKILDNSKKAAFKNTATSIINGVRQKLFSNNRVEEGDYEFTDKLFEKGGVESPFGGNILYRTDLSGCSNQIGDSICRVNYKTCSSSSTSFVRVEKVAGVNTGYSYSICLTAGEGNDFINLSSESELLGGNDDNVINNSSAPPTYYTPASPTISGGSTSKIYNYSNTTLTCGTTTQYDSDTTIYYEFGYASSTTNFTNGNITWLGDRSTSSTKAIAPNTFIGTRYYGCRIYLSNGSNYSEPVKSSGTTTLKYINVKLTFNGNGGTVNGSSTLYVTYHNPTSSVLTSQTNLTSIGTIPTATKDGATFTGWYAAKTGTNKIIDASGSVVNGVSSWTTDGLWQRTSNSTLYAHFS